MTCAVDVKEDDAPRAQPVIFSKQNIFDGFYI